MNNIFKTTLLLGMLTGLFLAIGYAMGGNSGMVIAFFMAAVMNFGSYWFSDKIVLAMYRAHETTPQDAPQLHAMIERLCAKAQLPKPKIYIIPDMQPNAFATGRNPQHAAVAATEGIMRILSMDELEGVMAHELAHVQHRDILISSIAATIAGAVMMVARMLQFAAIFGGMGGNRDDDREGANPIVMMAMIILAPIAAMIIQMWISRTREYLADAGGARMCGDPMSLANALRKLEMGAHQIPMDANPATSHMFIVNPLSGGKAFMSLFSTHPPMEERIARLEQMAREMPQPQGGDITFRRFL